MKLEQLTLWLLAFSCADALTIRQPQEYREDASSWRPQTKNPHFINLYVDASSCFSEPDFPGTLPIPNLGSDYSDDTTTSSSSSTTSTLIRREAEPQLPGGFDPDEPCLEGYVIRLNYGKVYAVPYSRYYGPLPTLFVDDDTRMYTIRSRCLNDFNPS